MKVEIELNDLERLRSDLKQSQNKVNELNRKIDSLNEVNLRKDAVKLAESMFNNAIKRVFIDLGFDSNSYINHKYDFESLEHFLGKYWWESEKLDIELGASITSKFKKAFLLMGISSDL